MRGARGDRGDPGVTVCDMHFISHTIYSSSKRSAQNKSYMAFSIFDVVESLLPNLGRRSSAVVLMSRLDQMLCSWGRTCTWLEIQAGIISIISFMNKLTLNFVNLFSVESLIKPLLLS